MDSEVFSINFIRRPFLPIYAKRLLLYFTLAYVAIQAFIIISIIAMTFTTNISSYHLERSIAKNSPFGSSHRQIETEITDLKNELYNCLSQLKGLIELEKGQFQIADKLTGIGRTIPRGTWITDLEGNQATRTLKMKAVYLVDPKNHSRQGPTKEWFEALRSDSDFGDGLKRIEFQKFSEKRKGNVNLQMFDILAEWQPAGEVHAK